MILNCATEGKLSSKEQGQPNTNSMFECRNLEGKQRH